MKKLSKRQVLNALLDAETESEKLEASQLRLDARKEKLKARHSNLAHQLLTIQDDEEVKTGKEAAPIVYKKHMFEPYDDSRMYQRNTYKCDIQPVAPLR